MTKKRPPYLIKRTGRQGETLWYYWRRPGPQVRIRGDYNSREFWDNYQAASRQETPSIRKPPETLGWLIDQYRQSAPWRDLAEGTRRVRDRIFHATVTKNPHLRYADVDRPLIVQTRDSKKHTPGAANTFLTTFSALFSWAVDAGYMSKNPVEGVKIVKRHQTDGFAQWTQEDLDAFKKRWPIGSRERLAFEILICTGLRRGDVAILGKQHIRNKRLRLATEKTKAHLDIPISDHLLKVIDASPTGDLALVADEKTGNPIGKEAFGKWFKRAALAAGIEGKNCHGLRKAAAVRLAEAGATIFELNAVFGWTGTAMASLYVNKANRKSLADSAVEKLSKP